MIIISILFIILSAVLTYLGVNFIVIITISIVAMILILISKKFDKTTHQNTEDDLINITARDILTPRVDVVAYDINDGIGKLINDKNFLKHSRIPVYSESLDNIIGILSTKRLLRLLVGGDEINIAEMMKPPLYVFQSRPVYSILNEFKQTNIHMAIVVDEFGGTDGILTLEDILEEIVGEIYDESDDVDYDLDTIDGSMNLYDMFKEIGYEPDVDFETNSTSAGGWITEMIDRFPAVGDTFEFDKYTFTIVKAQAKRVEKIKVTVNEIINDR